MKFSWSKTWMAAAVVAAIMGSVGCAGLPFLSGPTEVPQTPTPIPPPPARTEVVVNGSLVFPRRVETSFAAAGEVDAVLVSQGDRVTTGQLLARLDPDVTIALQQELSEAVLKIDQTNEAPGPCPAEVRALPPGRRGTPAQHSQGGAGDRRRRGTDNRLPVRPLPAHRQRRDGADRRGTRRCQRRGRAGRLRGGLPARPEAAQPGHRGPQGPDQLPGTGHGAGPDAAGQHQSRLPGPGGQRHG